MQQRQSINFGEHAIAEGGYIHTSVESPFQVLNVVAQSVNIGCHVFPF